MLGVTTAIIQDVRVQKKDGTYSIKLRLTHNRKQFYIPLGMSLTVEDWAKVQQPNSRGRFKELKFQLYQVEDSAKEILKSMMVFSVDSLKRKLLMQGTKEADLITLKKSYADQLRAEGRINSANDFETSLQSFKNFCFDGKRKSLPLDMITVDWLSRYEKWMLDRGRSLSTVGKYIRNLRTVYNIAIERGIMPKESYPFGKRKYRIPSTKKAKKALTLDQIKSIVEYQPNSKAEERSRDLWLFSYLCNGMNIKDMALLKFKDIRGDQIHYIRAKTARVNRHDSEAVVVYLMPQAKEIIARWGRKMNHLDSYVFDFISDSDLQKQAGQIRQAAKTINKYMERIGEKLEIPTKITTYTARHSYATVLKRSGASVEFISESLGHKDLKTTENYLDSFEDDIKRSFQKKLLEFN